MFSILDSVVPVLIHPIEEDASHEVCGGTFPHTHIHTHRIHIHMDIHTVIRARMNKLTPPHSHSLSYTHTISHTSCIHTHTFSLSLSLTHSLSLFLSLSLSLSHTHTQVVVMALNGIYALLKVIGPRAVEGKVYEGLAGVCCVPMACLCVCLRFAFDSNEDLNEILSCFLLSLSL